MNKLLLTLFIGCNFLIGNNIIECKSSIDKQIMIKLIEDIIETPTRMIEVMDNNETIDCSRIIELFKNEEWRLINFTMDIAYIKCRGYVFENIYESPLAGTDDLVYDVYYVKDEGLESEDLIRFTFYPENGSLIFIGITKPIG